MKTKELKETEVITRNIVNDSLEVYGTESPLAVAKDVQGLRAIFEEVWFNIYNNNNNLSYLYRLNCSVSKLLLSTKDLFIQRPWTLLQALLFPHIAIYHSWDKYLKVFISSAYNHDLFGLLNLLGCKVPVCSFTRHAYS